MNIKLAVVAIWAEDVRSNAHFYRDVIGLQLSDHHGAMVHFMVDGVRLVILKGRPAKASNTFLERFPIVAFETDNLDDAIVCLKAHQVELPWEIEENPEARWAMFHDPAGNLIEFVEFK